MYYIIYTLSILIRYWWSISGDSKQRWLFIYIPKRVLICMTFLEGLSPIWDSWMVFNSIDHTKVNEWSIASWMCVHYWRFYTYDTIYCYSCTTKFLMNSTNQHYFSEYSKVIHHQDSITVGTNISLSEITGKHNSEWLFHRITYYDIMHM